MKAKIHVTSVKRKYNIKTLEDFTCPIHKKLAEFLLELKQDKGK